MDDAIKLLMNSIFGKRAVIDPTRETYTATIVYPRHEYRKAWRAGVYICNRCHCVRQTARVRDGEYMRGDVLVRREGPLRGLMQEPSVDHPAWRAEAPECRIEHIATVTAAIGVVTPRTR